MRMLVESFRRLYVAKKVTKEEVDKRLENGLFNQEEYNYIMKP